MNGEEDLSGAMVTPDIDALEKASAEMVENWIGSIAERTGLTFDKSRWMKLEIDGEAFCLMTPEMLRDESSGLSLGLAIKIQQLIPKRCSFEDVDSLIQLLMLVAALLLSFAINLHTVMWDHDRLVDADERSYLWFGPQGRSINGGLLSLQMHFAGSRAVFCFTLCLVVGGTVAISLDFSDARENNDFFKIWFYAYKYVIFLCYICLLCGLFFLYSANHTAVDITYPRYDMYLPQESWRNASSGRMIESNGAIPYIQKDSSLLPIAFYISFGIVPVVALAVNLILKAIWKATESEKKKRKVNKVAPHSNSKSKQQGRNQDADFPINKSEDSEINSVSAFRGN